MDLAQPQGGYSILKCVEKLVIAPPSSRKAKNKMIKKSPKNNLSKAKSERKDKHVRKNWMKKVDNCVNLDRACKAKDVVEMSINDILMNQIVENLYSRFNIKVKNDHDNFCVSTPKTKWVKGKTFRVSSDSINKFLGLSTKIDSEFLDTDNIKHLNLIGRTLCEVNEFEWGKKAYIGQSKLTKVSAFWHLFVCTNLVGSSNASELNKEKIKIVFALVIDKPLNLGDLLIEHTESAASSPRLDKKLAFPGFITHFRVMLEVPKLDDDVLLPPLERFL
ncbi:hypothetical protein Dsin_001508 [Dipteronia sinensis]|uniref:Putative plant transposon protein domain-containing protein n=1 Tax=Dipteronia sinensis TaxID=43782 RepID=A0AAE0EJ23_9ROSI|nr:hypothetical protein Dsin_001508 [Dipteronia sinensis]